MTSAGTDGGAAAGPRLSAATRTSGLARLRTRQLDVLVVGGGVVGAGIALDAATRGLSVAVVEAQDWASGTSSRSTKLIHGGLRYLQMLDFYLVREALKERGLLLTRLAPHLVTKMPFIYPLRHPVIERAYTSAGIALYDALAWTGGHARGVPRQRQISRRRLYEDNPGLRPGVFAGGIEYYDAQMDDARFVVTLVRTAASLGAVALNRVSAVGIDREAGRVVGARLRDLERGEELTVRARSVILATGVWIEEAETLSGKEHPLRVQPSKGIHLVVPRRAVRLSSALVTQTERSFLFVIPWQDHWIIGTTDTPWEHDKARPVATSADIRYVLDHVNSVLAEPIDPGDVEAVFAGLRPLIAAPAGDTTKISREHVVKSPAPGLVAISGGKYTTYRVMAEDAVDVAVSGWEEKVPPSLTESTPLLGAPGVESYRNRRRHLADQYGLAVEQLDRLIGRYGTMVDQVLEPAASDPSLLDRLPGAPNYLRAEVLYGVTHEGALHAEDILRRRLRVDWETRDHGIASLGAVIGMMGDELDWSPARRAEEERYYRAMVDAELRAQEEPGDEEAMKIVADVPAPPWVADLA